MRFVQHEGKMWDVLEINEVDPNKSYYDKLLLTNNGLYVIYNTNYNEDNVAGFYTNGTYRYTAGEEGIIGLDKLIDLSTSNNIKELMEKAEIVDKLKNEVVSDSDSKTKYVIRDKDYPEMKALKEAINKKNIDIKSYKSRFGASYQNDIRLLMSHKISLDKLKRILDFLDVKVSIVLEDKHEGVSNPLEEKIYQEL